jgi:hypothetical protein
MKITVIIFFDKMAFIAFLLRKMPANLEKRAKSVYLFFQHPDKL